MGACGVKGVNLRTGRDGEAVIWACISVFGVSVVFTQVSWMGTLNPSHGTPRSVETVQPSLTIVTPPPRHHDPSGVREMTAGVTPPARNLLIQAIIQVESGGDSTAVGQAGERGLMQIMPGTWDDMTRRLYRDPPPFDQAFEPGLNQRIGAEYLIYLEEYLHRQRSRWAGEDMLSLLAACYNAGPGAVQRAGFSVERLPQITQEYVQLVRMTYLRLVRETGLRQSALRAQAPGPAS